jgi:hypothetical protein
MLTTSFKNLKTYCESQNFAGWDPYDGLNSKVFNATPLKYWDLARLAWIQFFKRSPLNLRPLLLVPKEYNAKGVALFLEGYCNLYNIIEKNPQLCSDFGTKEEILEKINNLSQLLISLQSKGYSGACWGYNFDWQARRLFLFPKNTPTVVATSFAASALFSAYDITKNNNYLDIALSSAQFVIHDLNRYERPNGFLFSYSPFDGNNTVINASLLGAKLLTHCYAYSQNNQYLEIAQKTIQLCCDLQHENGSWVYGLLPVQSWIDSFHTGYNLEALITYQNISGDSSFHNNIDKGFDFYIQNFFEEDGTPKYYHNKTFPIDIHCPGQLFNTLSNTNRFVAHKELADKVLQWTISNMQDPKGYFYYQKNKYFTSKISYMRWSNAFMFNALSCFLGEEYNNQTTT